MKIEINILWKRHKQDVFLCNIDALLGGQTLSITVVKAKRSEPSEGERKKVFPEREIEYVPTLHTMFIKKKKKHA